MPTCRVRPRRWTRSPRSPPTCPTRSRSLSRRARSLPLPVARLRAEGLVTELRHADLALTRSEAATLLRLAGLRLVRDDVDALLRSTEGWPAGPLPRRARRWPTSPSWARRSARFGGRERLVAEYLRDEVLASLAPDELRFVLRTSILDVLTAAACDAVARTPRLGRDAHAAAAVGLPARGARPHGRALPSPSPARRPAARRAAPRRAGPRARAAPARQRLARERRGSRARPRARARRGRARARRRLGLGRRRRARSSRARAPRWSTG